MPAPCRESPEFAQNCGRNVRIVVAAFLLYLAPARNAVAHLRGGDAVAGAAQFLIRYRGDLDVQIDAVEERTAQLALVTLDDGARAAAFPGGVAVMAARAGV
jgi:hypothetical protein